MTKFPIGEELFPNGQSTIKDFYDMMILIKGTNLPGCKKEQRKIIKWM